MESLLNKSPTFDKSLFLIYYPALGQAGMVFSGDIGGTMNTSFDLWDYLVQEVQAMRVCIFRRGYWPVADFLARSIILRAAFNRPLQISGTVLSMERVLLQKIWFLAKIASSKQTKQCRACAQLVESQNQLDNLLSPANRIKILGLLLTIIILVIAFGFAGVALSVLVPISIWAWHYILLQRAKRAEAAQVAAFEAVVASLSESLVILIGKIYKRKE